MITLRKTIVAVMATAIVATTTIASFDSAKAGPRMGMRNHGEMFHGGHGGHRGWGHRRHGGMGGFGTGMAIGLGVAMIGTAIAAAREAEDEPVIVARPRYRRVMSKPRPKAVKQQTAQQKRDCELAKQWAELVASAERLLKKDRELHDKYGEAGHSIQHVKFSEQELERRKEELRKAQERCNRQAAR